MLTSRYVEAFGYAAELHAGDVRKGGNVPYLAHLMTVSALVLDHGGDETQAVAGLLHDAAEDHGGRERLADIDRRFGSPVADIVAIRNHPGGRERLRTSSASAICPTIRRH